MFFHADTAWQIAVLVGKFDNPSTNFSVSVRLSVSVGSIWVRLLRNLIVCTRCIRGHTYLAAEG